MKTDTTEPFIDIVFNGPPGNEGGVFVEVENNQRKSICFGQWVERDDGYWALRIHEAEREQLRAMLQKFLAWDKRHPEVTFSSIHSEIELDDLFNETRELLKCP